MLIYFSYSCFAYYYWPTGIFCGYLGSMMSLSAWISWARQVELQ